MGFCRVDGFLNGGRIVGFSVAPGSEIRYRVKEFARKGDGFRKETHAFRKSDGRASRDRNPCPCAEGDFGKLPEAEKKELIEYARNLGFPVENLEFPIQDPAR